ncbi:MAG TPA: serine hydrolase domain-containing protein, partial [Steroidobacter sp.]
MIRAMSYSLLATIAISWATEAAAEPAALDTTAAATWLDAADLHAWLDGIVPYALDRGRIAGGVIVVVQDGRVILKRGYGYADVADRVPADAERTLFRIGSVSKLFTWTAVMQLVEQG